MGTWGRAAWRWCHQEAWVPEIAFVPFAVGLSWSLLAIKGIPQTHDGLGLVFIEAYRQSYLAGDYFPTWTAFGEQGHGSALLILYHRLHAQLAAVLALKTGTVAALKVSIPFFLTIGAMGMRRLCRLHGARPWVAWLAGLLLMSSQYALADWYIRGASAELAAFMLVPWGLRYAFELLDRRWGAVRLAIASSLIFYAHMMTFYFFVVTASVVVGGAFLRLRTCGWRRLRAGLWRATIFVALLTIAIGPYAAAVLYVSDFSAVGKLGMSPNPYAWSWFFADPTLSWSRVVVEGTMTLEVGRWCVLCLVLFAILAPAGARAIWQRAGGIVILAICFVILQHNGMAFWFDLLPGAAKIQFPGRLLVHIETITLLCMAIATEAALRSHVPFVRLVARVLPIVGAACQGNQARGSQSAIWGLNVERSVAKEALADDTDILTKKLSMSTSWGVFLPHLHGSHPDVQPFLKASDGCFISSTQLTAGLPVPVVPKNVAGPVTFTVHGKGCTVKLNQIQSPLLRVDLSLPGAMRQTDDGMTLIDAPRDGTVVRVYERGVMDLARKWLVQKIRRFP